MKEVFSLTTSIEVFEGDSSVLLGRFSDPNEVRQLLQHLATRPSQEEQLCLCLGSLHLLLHPGQQHISIHHGDSIRFEDGYNLDLEDGWALANWLASHHIPNLLLEMQEDQRSRARQELEQRDWESQVPASLRPTWQRRQSEIHVGHYPPIKETLQLLAAELPLPLALHLRLFGWLGSGDGQAVYQLWPLKLLQSLDPQQLLPATAVAHTDPELLGAFRYWDSQPALKKLLPSSLLERLPSGTWRQD